MGNYLVVGGSSGIGAATVDLLSDKGHQVIASYNEHEKNDISNVQYVKHNVMNDIDSIDIPWEQLDGLVYCPGSIHLKPFHRFTKQDFLHDYELQVLGGIRMIQKMLPLLKKSENASVVLFSTIAVQKGFNFHSLVATSKGAIEGLTRSLAAELAPGIRVNAIAPSITDTNLGARILNTDEKKEALAKSHPLKSIGHPKNVAETVLFLLTPLSSWITGQILHVDGGKSSISA